MISLSNNIYTRGRVPYNRSTYIFLHLKSKKGVTIERGHELKWDKYIFQINNEGSK